jgi:urease accessory protein
MGAAAARITAADFLTPPELEHFQLASNPAGRIGGVRFELLRTHGQTVLGDCYQQVPLRILPPFQFGRAEPVLLYLLNPTAGLMDGDAQLVQLRAGEGTRAVVTGQSATRIHPSLEGYSTQQWRITVGSGAVLVVLPGPAIPFGGCRYYQRVRINLEADAALVWGDIWLAGRYARREASEQFQFLTMIQDLAVCRDQRLVFRDRFCWQGPWDRAKAEWHFGTALACGTLFVTGSKVQDTFPDTEGPDGICFRTAGGDRCYRWQGGSQEVTGRLVTAALTAASYLAGHSPGEPWLMTRYDLASNHWFTRTCARSTAAGR